MHVAQGRFGEVHDRAHSRRETRFEKIVGSIVYEEDVGSAIKAEQTVGTEAVVTEDLCESEESGKSAKNT